MKVKSVIVFVERIRKLVIHLRPRCGRVVQGFPVRIELVRERVGIFVANERVAIVCHRKILEITLLKERAAYLM